ncbi:NADH-quinone oxidoreductase subunit H [Candidatus Uhrbacteria bacterium]|nr:NADH-quinone oxidoreductase subunit H [Candidatus Uhrbacteria bacterium]
MITVITLIIQVILVLLVAPFVTGLVRWFKARLQGRQGASPFLVYYALLTTLKKEHVISASRSWMFRLVPFMVLGVAVFLALSPPLLFSDSGISQVDLFVLAGVLALSSVFLVFGGLDAATAFGGMGASREMTLAALIEPAVLTTFAAFATVAGSASVQDIFGQGMSALAHPALLLSFGALILITLAENARYPVDNPATHLELTMVHEAMVLEYSGPYLAMLEYASSLKLTVFLLILGNLIWVKPEIALDGTTIGIAMLGVLASVVVGSFMLALLESSIAKMRFFRMQEYMSIAFFLALSGLILVLVV